MGESCGGSDSLVYGELFGTDLMFVIHNGQAVDHTDKIMWMYDRHLQKLNVGDPVAIKTPNGIVEMNYPDGTVKMNYPNGIVKMNYKSHTRFRGTIKIVGTDNQEYIMSRDDRLVKLKSD